MGKPICTLTNHQFCWNLKVDTYDNTVGNPEYFACHYYFLGYRIRIEQNRIINNRPTHICVCEDFNPLEQQFYDISHSEVEAPAYEEIVNPEPSVEATKVFVDDTTSMERRKAFREKTGHTAYQRGDGKTVNHKWERVQTSVSEAITHECPFCGCRRLYEKNRYRYITVGGLESRFLPKCFDREDPEKIEETK